VNLIKNGLGSAIPRGAETFEAEGVVAKTAWPLYDRRGARLAWKLKASDFRAGRR
jgi:hypothetical protein